MSTIVHEWYPCLTGSVGLDLADCRRPRTAQLHAVTLFHRARALTASHDMCNTTTNLCSPELRGRLMRFGDKAAGERIATAAELLLSTTISYCWSCGVAKSGVLHTHLSHAHSVSVIKPRLLRGT